MKVNEVAPCRLCLAHRHLKRSHIVPEFMYSPIYNQKHQIYAIRGTKKVQVKQIGARERLLCLECEGQFGRYEDYAASAFFRKTYENEEKQGRVVLLRGLQYQPLKLFFLSLLWRFGVTSIDLLKGADLGPHLERLREMLVNKDPGYELDYPCTVTEVGLNGVPLHGWILPPKRSRPHGHIVWNITLGRFLFCYYVSSHGPPEGIQPIFLSRSGTMGIYRADLREIPSLMWYARRLINVDF